MTFIGDVAGSVEVLSSRVGSAATVLGVAALLRHHYAGALGKPQFPPKDAMRATLLVGTGVVCNTVSLAAKAARIIDGAVFQGTAEA